ncbi:MAG: type II toxin-antitoxin system RelE/ParE family toxin [Candidatus Acidiferrales bacterium]
MAAKPLDIHPAALAELKSAVSWYDERSASAGDGFVAEIDRAIELITAAPDIGKDAFKPKHETWGRVP